MAVGGEHMMLGKRDVIIATQNSKAPLYIIRHPHLYLNAVCGQGQLGTRILLTDYLVVLCFEPGRFRNKQAT
jgi:hypothetical protein